MKNIRYSYSLQVHKPSYFICVILFWYITEMLFSMKVDSILGIPIEMLNSAQSYIVLGLLLIKIIFLQHYNRLALKRIILCGVIVLIATFCSGFSNTFLSLTLFVIAVKDEKIEDVIRTIYKTSVVMIPLIALLSLTGIVENYMIFRGTIPRYSLGFNHPNTLGRRLYILVACRFYLRFHKLSRWDYLLAVAAAVFCYTVPNSMAATLLLIMLIVFTLVYKVIQRMNGERAFFYTLIFLAFAVNIVSIVLGSIDLSKYPILALLDVRMHGRFSTGYQALKVYGVKWFGQKVYTLSQIERLGLTSVRGVRWLDNSYYNILYRYGIIVYLGFSSFFLYNMVLQMRKKNAALVIFLFVIALYGVAETELYSLSTNVFLLSLADVIYASELYRVRGGRRKQKEGALSVVPGCIEEGT